jgi:uncharacterized protein (TIGR02594 family)
MIETPDWLVVALDEAAIGVVEVPGPETNARIRAYMASTTYGERADEIPWCADFVCHCLEETHHRSPRSALARSFLGWGRDLTPPAYGAIVVFSRGENPPPKEVLDAPGHVGFLISTPTPHEVMVLGGNQSNQVCQRPYPRDRILGVRWPW